MVKWYTLSALAVVVASVAWKRLSLKKANIFMPVPGSLLNKNVLITGGTTGLGLESAKRLAAAGASVIVTARSDAKGQAAVEAVSAYLQEQGAQYVDQSISYRILELDKLSAVKRTAEWLDDLPEIHVLMNNAGIMALPDRELTEDGMEKQIHTNHLGHFVLTAILKDKFAEDCRIITVSSSAHRFARFSGGLDFDYLWKAETGYGAMKSYGQSKLANIYFTQALQRRIDAAALHWTATAVHPGAVFTDLGRNLVKNEFWQTIVIRIFHAAAKVGIIRSVEEGASTQIWLAASTDAAALVGGAYYADRKAATLASFATNESAAERLWRESEQLSGVALTLQAVDT